MKMQSVHLVVMVPEYEQDPVEYVERLLVDKMGDPATGGDGYDYRVESAGEVHLWNYDRSLRFLEAMDANPDMGHPL